MPKRAADALSYRERAWHALELALAELDMERAALVSAMAALRREPVPPAVPKARRKPGPKPRAPEPPLPVLPDEATVRKILALLDEHHRTADVAGLLKMDIDGARVVLKALVAHKLVTRGPGGHWHRAEGADHVEG